MVWYRCAENMDFREPRESINNVFLATPATFPMESVRLQGLGDMDEVDEEVIEFGNSGPYAPDMVNFPGTGVRSVRALMQKPSRMLLNSTYITAYNTVKGTLAVRVPVLGFLPSSTPGSGSFDPVFTWAGYYRGMYAAVASSERFGILTTVGCTSGAARVAPGTSGQFGSVGCSLMPFQFADGGQSFTNVPWQAAHRFFNGASQDSPTVANTSATMVVAAPLASVGAQVNDFALYHSFCDDLRLGRFMQTPLIDWQNFAAPTAAPSTFWQRV